MTERGLLLAGWDPNRTCFDEKGNYIPPKDVRPPTSGKLCKGCLDRKPIENFMVGGKARSTCSDCRS